MKRIGKLLARWWLRIILFILLFFGYAFIINFLISALKCEHEIYQELLVFLSLLFSSLTVESLRKSGKWFTFGIMSDRKALTDFFSGCAYGLSPIIIILLIGLAGGQIQRTNDFRFSLFIEFSVLIFFAAAAEEFFFRGIIFQALISRFGNFNAVFILSVIFCFAHVSNFNITAYSFVNLFMANIVLSLMYIQTKSLWMPVSFHFFWNFGQAFIIGSNVSGFDFKIAFLKIKPEAPVILFGGNFGIEGSLLATVLLISMIPVVLKYSTTSPYIASVLFKRDYAEEAAQNPL